MDFSGTSGVLIKNSIYSVLTSVVGKIGSLLFTAIIVGSSFLVGLFSLFSIKINPLLTPEQFGLYSLAISTILIFAGLSDLGVGEAIIRYLSKYPFKTKGYIIYLAKIKAVLIFISVGLLIASSYFIANYYQKPIFLSLIAGSMYLIGIGILGFISNILQSRSNFKNLFFRELFFQTARLIIVPILIVISISRGGVDLTMILILGLAFCYLLTSLFLNADLKNYGEKDINRRDKIELQKFLIPISITVLSGSFFGYIDMIMLGGFVSSEYIGYYQAAFSLIGSGITIFSFSSVFLPLFSRLKKRNINFLFFRTIIIVGLISVFGILATIFLADFLIKGVYNIDYSPSILLLKVFAILLFIEPIIGVYNSFFISEGRTYFIAKALVVSTIINIGLNYILIVALLGYSEYAAVFGVVISSIVSRGIYLGFFVTDSLFSKKKFI